MSAHIVVILNSKWFDNIFILLLALLIHHVTCKGIFQPLRVMQF